MESDYGLAPLPDLAPEEPQGVPMARRERTGNPRKPEVIIGRDVLGL